MARLVLVKGPLDGDVFPIDKGVTIGRERHNDISMPKNRKCSRDHCKIWEIGPAKYAVADLGSTNGTLLNDARTTRGDLADGDHVQVGDVVFRFELDEDEKPKPKVRVDEEGREDFAAILRGDKPREDKPLAASIEGHAAIQIKERILQYQKKSKQGSQLGWDLSQMSGGMRWLLILLALAGGIALFIVFMGIAGG
jgi:pSer/pThr/pTyr-binding forkhead associated (FHA) protein